MLSPMIAVLMLLFAEAPVAAAPPAPAPAATAPAVAATPAAPAVAPVNPVTAEINALIEPYRGKSGNRLRGKLGFSAGTRKASDGEVVFWMINVQQEMNCGVDPASGAMRCLRADPLQCRLAMAFDTAGIVKAWAVTGAPEVCRGFVDLLKAP
ncbi:MAG: hypothetical protein K9G59_11075 [Caulobacter sp.]|nr:hypothetical protein [Caulobacter sp.]